MCRGSCSEKASFMFDLIMQQNKEKDPSKRILYWNHPKLRKAIRMLVYISELLPKKNKLMLNQGPGQVKISQEYFEGMDEEIKDNYQVE